MSRLHLMFRFEEAAVPKLAALRHRWDPVMAAKVPPHVTLTYPQELSDQESLVVRGSQAAAVVTDFVLTTRGVGTDNDDGTGGVWMKLDDPTGSWARLRSLIVPDSQVQVGPHLTIVHPRTSDQGPIALPELQALPGGLRLAMKEFVLTSTTSDESSRVLHRFPLGTGLTTHG